jgi:WD40 repeat protein
VSPDPSREFAAVTVSPDGSLLFGFDRHTRTIHSWSTDTLEIQKQFIGHSANLVACIAVSPDNNTLASGGKDNTTRLWDIATGEELVTIDGQAVGP